MEQDLFPNLPRSTVAKTERDLWNEFRRDQAAAGGLLTSGCARVVLGISAQRLCQIADAGLIRVFDHFGTRFYSASDIEQRLVGLRDGRVAVGRPALAAA